MKTIIAFFVFATVQAQASSVYECSSRMLAEPVMISVEGVKAEHKVGNESQACEAVSGTQELSQLDSMFKEEFGIAVRARLAVICTAPVADAAFTYVMTDADIPNAEGNTVIFNPMVGPVAVAKCHLKK